MNLSLPFSFWLSVMFSKMILAAFNETVQQGLYELHSLQSMNFNHSSGCLKLTRKAKGMQ